MNETLNKTIALPYFDNHRYKNPLPIEAAEDGWTPDSNADPYVVKYKGQYYCYSTYQDGVVVMHSKNLVEWDRPGFALKNEAEKHYWAPAVVYHNGLFYMYYSSMKGDEEDHHNEFMKIAISDNPEGPFKYEKTLFNYFSIDPHVVKDKNGDFNLYYTVSNYQGVDHQKPGTVNVVDKLLDLLTPQGRPEIVVEPTINEEIYEKNRFGDGRDWYCIEGAFYLPYKGKEYLMYSGNAFTSRYYFVGYSIKDPNGEWKKYPDDNSYFPVVKKNDYVEGTGHNSVVRGLNNINNWFVYHGRTNTQIDQGESSLNTRKLRIDPLFWSGDKIWVAGPSYNEQARPLMPDFCDFFEGEGEPSLPWKALTGSWEISDGELAQTDLKQISDLVLDIDYPNYVMEISLKCEPSFMGGLFGMYCSYLDDNNNLRLLFDVGRREIVIFEKVNGVKGDEIRIDLNKDINLEEYHHIRINRTKNHFMVFLDDMEIIDDTFKAIGQKIGLITNYTKAKFAGLSITRHIELNKSTSNTFLEIVEDKSQDMERDYWQIAEGNIICNNNSDQINQLLVDHRCGDDFQMMVDCKIDSNLDNGAVGIFFNYYDSDNFTRIIMDNDKLKVKVVKKIKGKLKLIEELDLPSNINLNEVHCILLRVKKQRCFILLDEYLLYESDINLERGNSGLLCQGNAIFKNFQITGI